ncbi:MAG TPA: NAD(P)/FAD-dependent oxidoreductase [Spirochaetota bacterium]|nr:NAD(P)/FAD-dependent oxidoreductase [Spirochaetota bacterium]
MKILINNIKLRLEDDITLLQSRVSKKLSISSKDFTNFKIVKESIDARKKNNINLIYSATVEVDSECKLPFDNDIKKLDSTEEEKFTYGTKKLNERPVIVGSGPAGLFAALLLSEYGFKPLLIERGDSVENRIGSVTGYWEKGILDTESNIQFGEGGAGTFSDGKLTTRINDHRCEKVLKEFNKSGISEEILYKAKPHIGTDKLRGVLVNIRKRIIQNGGEIRFRTKLESLNISNGKITSVLLNSKEIIPAEVVVLAIGHSARDTFTNLYSQGIFFEQKPFSVGVRIEHPQKLIDKAQFGIHAGHPKLGEAEYHLFYKTGERTVYSFCMCPGGIVVASASESGMIVTNGMSEFARNRENANSAWVVSVAPVDFASQHPLSGIEFQRNLERLAFKHGGEDNSAPIQTLKDFANGVNSTKIGGVKPSYTGKTKIADINNILPGFITNPMKESIKYFNSKLTGFGINDALLTGVETRTSSPVRITRDDSLQALRVRGLYPSGEGAGYAGGIVSAAVDGMRVAEEIIKTYRPSNF